MGMFVVTFLQLLHHILWEHPLATSRAPRGTSEEIFKMQLVYSLVNQCKFLPESVSFKCDELASTNLWMRRNVVLLNLLGGLLREVKSLKFTAESNNTEVLSIPRNILEVVFFQPVTMLTSLSLDGHPDFVLRAVADAVLFFAPICCTQDRNFLHFLYPQLHSCSLPYSRLTSLDIQGCDEIEPSEQATLQKHLNSIVLNQSALEAVTFSSIKCFSPCSNTSEFYTTLGHLFYEPQFKFLCLDGVDLDWDALVALIPPFLTSPISPGRKQELHFENNFFLVDGPLPQVENFHFSSNSPGKVLRFENIFYPDNPYSFLQWLTELNVPSMLSSLEFSINNLDYEPPEVLGTVMCLLRNETSAALLESFSVSLGPLFLYPSPEEPFDILFGAMRLKKVSFDTCDIKDKLPLLTQGLRKQVPLGVLEELSLDGNDIGCSSTSDGDFQDFADAVFCLPQLTELKLSLQYNRLKSHHFTLLYSAWRCSMSRAPMKTLNIKGNEYQDHASLLQQVAVSGDFVASS